MADGTSMDEMAFANALRYINLSMDDKVEGERHYFRQEYYPDFVRKLDPFLDRFFKEHKGSFPAVDIGSGMAVQTIGMALNFRKPIHKGELIWYPSDYTDGDTKGEMAEDGGALEKETRASLRYHIEETKEISSNPLFTDKVEKQVFKGDIVEMSGLKSALYNGRKGIIRGPDPKAKGRFGVQLSPDNLKSFKQGNLSYAGEFCPGNSILRTMRQKGADVEFFEDLLKRARDINILEKSTWSHVSELYGKCALVTCTSLLTTIGYRDPMAWKDTMELASKLLHSGGYLAQFDTYRRGNKAIGQGSDEHQFGDGVAMQAFAEEKSLGLTLIASNIPQDELDNKMFVWQKTC